MRRAPMLPQRATADCWYDFLGRRLVVVVGRSARPVVVRSDAMARRLWFIKARPGFGMVVAC